MDDLRMQYDRALSSRLRMKLCLKGKFEQNMLDDVRTIGTRQREGFPAKDHIIEAPGWSGECRRIAHLTIHPHQRKTYGSAGRIASSPRFARSRVGGMAIGT